MAYTGFLPPFRRGVGNWACCAIVVGSGEEAEETEDADEWGGEVLTVAAMGWLSNAAAGLGRTGGVGGMGIMYRERERMADSQEECFMSLKISAEMM